MLLWMKNLVFFCIFHDGADYHMLKKLARYAGEGDGLVIFRLASFPFLEHRCSVGRFPVLWHSARLHRCSVDQD